MDEVDAFLDRVEATLAGKPIGEPVLAQDVHDVVFRVRFGGYDEWQVDLHLDRVERQLAEMEERGLIGRGSTNSRTAPPERMGPPPERTAPPARDERGMAPIPPPLPPRPMPAQAGPPPEYGPRYDEPTSGFGGYGDRRGYPRAGGPAGSAGVGGYGAPEERFDGFEAGRHARADMTAEIRMPEHDPRLAGPGVPPVTAPPVGPPMSGPGVGGPGMTGPGPGGPSMGGPGMGGPGLGGPGGPGMGGGLGVGGPGGPGMGGPVGVGADPAMQRVDQIRRTFQVRRFGSGYDPQQVDRFFEELLAAMAGRGPMPVHENDLDTVRFGLVTGGYFEAEVDAALKEVKEILLRRR